MMKKRMISMFLAIVMVIGMLPAMPVQAALSTQEAEELYIQMLQLGLVDENGALIEDTVFIDTDNGNLLAGSLTQLRAVFESPDLDLAKTVQVWGTGGTATLEQLFIALSIEDQMAELASGMNTLAGGSNLMTAALTDTGFDKSAQIARHNLRLNISISPDSVIAHDDSLYLSLSLLNAEGYHVTTTEDVTVNIGLFADFLTDGAMLSNTAEIGTDPTNTSPTTVTLTANAMTTITVPAGQSYFEAVIDTAQLREMLTANQPGHLDGAAYMTVQWNGIRGANGQSGSKVIELALPESSTLPVVEYSLKDTMYQTDIPYAYVKLDKDTHAEEFYNEANNGRGHKITLTLTDYLISTEEGTGTLRDTVTRIFPALRALGMGDTQQTISFDNVSIVGYKQNGENYALDFSYIWQNEEVLYSDQQTAQFSDTKSHAFERVFWLIYEYISDFADAYSQIFDTDLSVFLEPAAIEIASEAYGVVYENVTLPVDMEAEIPTDPNGGALPTTFVFTTGNLIHDGFLDKKNTDLGTDALDIDIPAFFFIDKARFVDTTAPRVTGISWPEDVDFYPGQQIPITVTFSEPVCGSYQLVYNTAEDGGVGNVNAYLDETGSSSSVSNTRTFLYTVQDRDSTLISVLGVKAVDENCTDYLGNAFENGNIGYQECTARVAEGHIISASLEDSISSFQAYKADGTALVNTVAAGVDTVVLEAAPPAGFLQDWANWNNTTESERTPVYFVRNGDTANPIPVSVEMRDDGYVVTGTDELDLLFDNSQELFYELYYGNAPIYGPHMYLQLTQQPTVKVAEGYYSIWLETESNVGGLDLDQENFPESEWPSGRMNTLYLLDTTLPRLTRSTYYDYDAPVPTNEGEYIFHSSDESVLRIQNELYTDNRGGVSGTYPSGLLIPVSMGTVTVTLYATNGSTRQENWTAVDTVEITVTDGSRPGINIPHNLNTFTTRINEDITIPFISNLVSISTGGDPITIKMFDERFQGSGAYKTWMIDRTASSVVIPGEYFQYTSTGDSAAYRVELSTTVDYDGESSNGAEGNTSATAYIIVRAQPATVKLSGFDSTSYPAGSSVTVHWEVGNLDTLNPNEFDFLVTCGEDAEVVYHTTEVSESGSYTINFAAPTGERELRTVYVVTAKAKNYAAPTWSADSVVFNVYRDNALQIMVDGQDAGNSVTLKNEVADQQTTTSPTIQNVNGAQFSNLSTAQAIAAMRSQLGLVKSIQIDTSTYDWNELNDMIEWTYSNPDAVTVNYRRGSIYEPLENFSYTAYLPSALLALCGVGDGSGVVTATHSGIDGLTDSVTIDVERLAGKLWLFQFAPAVETTVTYYTNKGEEKSVTSNPDGSLALYEPDGIGTEEHPYVWAVADVSGVTYMGGWNLYSLRSGEGVGTLGELYPLNALDLRRAAYASITLVKPDGTPYANAPVTLRGGVYRNSEYCPEARFSNSHTLTPNDNGTADNIYYTDAYGILHIYMATDQFTTATHPELVTSKDVLKFIFELRFGSENNQYTDYFPVLHTVDASINHQDATRTGEHIVTLKEVPDDTPRVFVAAQTVDYGTGREIDCLTHTGVIGPSANYPTVKLGSYIMLWGQEDTAQEGYEAILHDEYSVSAPDQLDQTVANSTYPFSSIPLIRHDVTFVDETIWFNGSRENRQLIFTLNRNGTFLSFMPLEFRLVNMFDIEKVQDSKNVRELLYNIAAFGTMTGADTSVGIVNSISDGFLSPAIGFLSDMSSTIGISKGILNATEDPTRFTGYIWSGLDLQGLDEIPVDASGFYVEGSLLDIEIADTFGISDFQAMADGSFFEETSNITSAAASVIGIPIVAKLEGWMGVEIRYNFDKMEWEVITTGGGFTAGAGLRYEKTFNIKPMGIPLTATFLLEGDMVIDFQTAVRYAEQLGFEWNDKTAKAVNDYLTALRIRAYFEAFGGLGHDKGVTAKVGVYGSIEIDNENRFLTRNYLKEASQRSIGGQYLKVAGETGLRMEFGMAPALISVTIGSVGLGGDVNFNNWDEINNYWKFAVSDAGGTGTLDPGLMSLRSMNFSDFAVIDQSIALESRNYLASNARSWAAGAAIPAGVSTLHTNAYPGSYPVLSDDGQLMLYLSDADSEDITDVEVRYSMSSGSGFGEGTAIDSTVLAGYGDSGLTLDGNSRFAGAAWLRQTQNLELTAGSELTASQLSLLFNGSEVMVALWNGSSWNTTRITTNATQELSPVVAVNENGQAILVWRSVETSGNEANPLEVTQERLLYKVYTNNEWSTETYTLFNGSSGFVKGVDAELLADGTAAVAYALDTGSEGNIEDYEVCYALLDIDEAFHEDNARTVRITTDRHLDEAPQLTTAKLDGGEHFVLGWHSYQNTSGVDTHDLRLAVFDANGTPRTDIPGSLSDMVGPTAFNGQFTFAEGADTFEGLSVVYTEASLTEDQGDSLRSIRFSAYDGSYIPSAPLTVGELENAGTAEWYDAYTSGNTVAAIIQSDVPIGTASETIHRYKNGSLVEEEIVIETSRTDLCTASASYSENFSVDSVIVDYSSLRTNSYTPVSFTITNLGTRPMTEVTIDVGGQTQSVQFDNLLPGKSKTVSVVYLTGSEITNPPYTISGTDSSTSGTVYLDYPDVGISGLTIIKEYDGVRCFNVNLYDQAAAALYQSDRRVVVGVYEDPGCTTLMNGTYFGGSAAVVVSSADIMNAIDAGYYPAAMTFDAKAFAQAQGYDELPAGGIPMYVKVSVEELRNGKWVTLPEANSADNLYTFTAESLLSRNGGKQITEQTSMDNTSGITNATVTVSNNSISKTGAGIVTAVLMDGNGNVLETKQSNTSLKIEDVQAFAFAFSQAGASVIASYAETTNDASNAELASISLGNTVLSISGETMTLPVASGTHTLILSPKNPNASVSVDGTIAEDGVVTVNVTNSPKTITAVVTSENGAVQKTYTFILGTGNAPVDPVPTYTVTFNANGGSVSPASAETGTDGKLASLPTPIRARYTFDGWFTASSGGTEVTADTVFSGDTTIYAQWTEITVPVTKYDVTVIGSYADNTGAGEYATGETVTLYAGSRSGYTFDGWTSSDITITNKYSNTITFTMPAADVTVTANWTNDSSGGIVIPTVFPVTVRESDNGEVEASAKYAVPGSTVKLTVTPDEGYELDTLTVKYGNKEVQTTLKNGKYQFTMPFASVAVTAAFKKIETSSELVTPAVCTGDRSCPMYGYIDLDSTAWYHDGIHFCIDNKLMNGVGDDQFNPGGTTTRAMIVTILWRLEGQPVINYLMQFDDVVDGQWYTDAIRWAASEKIVDGYGNGYFGTNDAITREQFVTIMFRYAKYKGYDVSVGENTNILSYDDAFDIADWAIPAMQWACGSGLIQGIADDNQMNLEPQGNATRAQAATILYRFCDKMKEN